MHKKGKTVSFADPPVITGHAGVAGKKEGEGPLGGDFDAVFADTTMGQQSFELAESAMLRDAILRALSAAGKKSVRCGFYPKRRPCWINVWALLLPLRIWTFLPLDCMAHVPPWRCPWAWGLC